MLVVSLKRRLCPCLIVLCCFLLTTFWKSRNFHGAMRIKMIQFHKYIFNDITTKTSMDQADIIDTQTLTPVDTLYCNKYFKYKKLEQFSNTLAYLSKSRVRILNTDDSNFKVGDTIRIRMELYNVSGDFIPFGGDFIKIWMKDIDKKAGSTGYVIDHGNGSYTGVIRALWSGTPVIKIAHSFTKEATGLFVNYLREYKMYYKIFGVFKNSHKKTRKGICGTHQHIGDSVCNFTSLNSGMRWYCALPVNFTCDDRIGPFAVKIKSYRNNEFSFLRSNSERILKKIQINVNRGLNKETDIPCSNIKPSCTWNKISPVGFVYQNVWRNLICNDSLSHSVLFAKKCLANREIYMFGDSTTRIWLTSMVEMFDLKYIIRSTEHKPVKVQSKSSTENISVMWMPHELPFSTTKKTAVYDDFKAPSYYLENITSKNPLIFLHWYLHLAITLPSVFQEHVQNAKTAIIKFLKRTPDAKIFIKGPHNVITETKLPGIPYDFARFYMEDILFREFQEIKDKVFFLNEWDITVSHECKDRHPPDNINRQMIHNFLTLIC